MVKNLKIFLSITGIIIILDQLVKYIVQVSKPNFSLLFFNISYVENTGAGFGILKGNSLYLGLFSLVVALLIGFYYKKFSDDKKVQIPLALFLAGTLGNMIDRLLREYVIDFIGTSFFPSFNVADAALTISIVLFLYFSFFEKEYELFKIKK